MSPPWPRRFPLCLSFQLNFNFSMSIKFPMDINNTFTISSTFYSARTTPVSFATACSFSSDFPSAISSAFDYLSSTNHFLNFPITFEINFLLTSPCISIACAFFVLFSSLWKRKCTQGGGGGGLTGWYFWRH